MLGKRSLLTLIFLGLTVLSCGDDSSDNSNKGERGNQGQEPEPSPSAGSGTEKELKQPSLSFEEALTSFSTWTPVLEGDAAFQSQGHGGIWVRSYLSPTTKEHLAQSENPYPLPEGSLLAKAVVANADTPLSEATTVYFMRKEAAGYDPEGGDWSYAVAKRQDDALKLDPSITPTFSVCVSCHVKFKEFDNVQTVEFYQGRLSP